MVLVLKWPFFLPFFLGNIVKENVFYDILQRRSAFLCYKNKKKLFQAIKRRRSKSRKIDIFPNGLTHGFGPKMAIFPTFFFKAIQARKMSFMIFQNENTPFQASKTRSLKSRKIDIFPNEVTHGFGPKKANFPTFLFGNLVRENVFYGILERENAFLSYKNGKFKKSNN